MTSKKPSSVFETAIARKRDANGVLATPIHALEALWHHPRRVELAQWWWFNPFGFTFCGLRMWDSEDGQHRLIGVAQWHPQMPDLVVYAAGSREHLMDPSVIADVANGVFACHGRAGPAPILPTLPTGIDLRGTNAYFPFLAMRLRERMLELAAREDRRSLLTTSAFLEATRGDPYQRCSMDFLGADRAAIPKLRELAVDDSAANALQQEVERIVSLCGEDASSPSGDASTEDEVRRWWELVTHPEHLESERSIILG